MSFASAEFGLFIAVVFGVYWWLPHRHATQNLVLLIASATFYALCDWRMFGLFSIVIFWTYIFGLLIDKRVGGKMAIVVALTGLLGVLGVFKYANFFVCSVCSAMAELGFVAHPTTFQLLLPLGISFYTFMAIGYLIDVYKREQPVEKDLCRFALYLMFFPQVAAGPIGRAGVMLPQYAKLRTFDYPLAVEGCRQMLWGFFKKILVADTCAMSVNQLLVPDQTATVALWIGALLYAIQIYADFSGYSDMAIGCGKLFGIRLTRNFEYPYFARNVSDFWRRWHMSLTRWLTDYVYIPIGGSRCSTVRRIINTLIVFLVSGLWHGANWTFVFWGGIHGLLFIPLILRGKGAAKLPSWVAYPLTWVGVVLAWVLFCAPSMSVAAGWLKCMLVTYDGALRGLGLGGVGLGVAFAVIMLALEWLGRRHEVLPICSIRFVRWFYYIMLACSIFYFYPVAKSFIYFQF